MNYTFPVVGKYSVTSPFGPRLSPTLGASSYHKGIDIAVPIGTNVVSAKAGVVSKVASSKARGNYVVVDHGNGENTLYQHLKSVAYGVGTKVKEGQSIALSGSTGIGTGPHLHFEVLQNGKNIDPMKWNPLEVLNMDNVSSFIDADNLIGIVKDNWVIISVGLLVIAIIK